MRHRLLDDQEQETKKYALCNCKNCKFSKTPIKSISPSKKLSLRSSVSRLVNEYNAMGMLPVNSLKSRSMKTSFVNNPISDGIVDERPAEQGN